MADKITLEFPDGSKKKYDSGVNGIDIAKEISNSLARNAFAVKLNEEYFDLTEPIKNNAKIKFITWDDEAGKEIFRHTAAHVFAHALVRVFPEAKIAIGPPIENGFHYDFELKQSMTPEDLKKIEKEMEKITSEKHTITKKEIPKKEALKLRNR